MLPQYRPISNGFRSANVQSSRMPYAWRGPSGVGALGAATQSIGPAPSASGPAGTGAGAPSDSGNDPGPGPGAPGAGGPFSANDPAAAAGGASGLGFDAPSRADMTASAVGAMSNMAGLGGPISGALGAAAGVAAGNTASKGAGQFGGGLVGGAFFGPLGAMVGAYVGGKFGSGEWGFGDRTDQFDPSDPGNMGRVGSGLNADNTPNNAPGPAPGLGLGVAPGVTSADLGTPGDPGPGLDGPGPGLGLGPNGLAGAAYTADILDAPWQAGPGDTGNQSDDGKGGKEGGFGPAAPGPDFSNMYAANERTTATDATEGGGGDGSGGGCVVCTTLHDHRLVEPIIYRAITAYGALVNDTTMRGYHWWGKPLARFLDRSALARWAISPLARPVVRELAFRGGIGKSTWLGRRLLGLGEIACAAVATLLTPKQGSCENCKCRLN